VDYDGREPGGEADCEEAPGMTAPPGQAVYEREVRIALFSLDGNAVNETTRRVREQGEAG